MAASPRPPSPRRRAVVGDPGDVIRGASYAAKYGIPPANLPFDWVAEGQIAPGTDFITRFAPGLGRRQGVVSRWSPGQGHSWEVDDG
jgi:hypothetical protein